jgi:hypothetical protein
LGDIRVLDENEMRRVLDKFRTYGDQNVKDTGLLFGGTLQDAAKGSRP